jgi:hypothetical protein
MGRLLRYRKFDLAPAFMRRSRLNMDPRTRDELRQETQHRRRPPGVPLRVQVELTHDGDGSLPAPEPSGPPAPPAELWLEATTPEGVLSPWLNDLWWSDVLQAWGDELLSVHILPTPTALLHPWLNSQLKMVRRVAPRWRLVGHAYAHECSQDTELEAIATSLYHEVRFIETAPPSGENGSADKPTVAELIRRVRDRQTELGIQQPVLVCLPMGKSDAVRQLRDPESASRATDRASMLSPQS